MTHWVALIMGTAVVLSACTATVRPQQTMIDVPAATVTVGGTNGGAGSFCPPGQAKKGRC